MKAKTFDSRRMFQAINVIKRHQENQIFVNDKNGNLAGDTTSKIAKISKHFKGAFQKDNAIKCPEIAWCQ